MKIVGLITEYNPFHNGHLHHLEMAKKVSGADVAISVMSGDFVQRGLPAVCDKYLRARAALSCGVDAVFELPTYFATSSAERFAKGAVDILAGLGVDEIVYGCEGVQGGNSRQGSNSRQEGEAPTQLYNSNNFKKLAEILCDEPDEYRVNLKNFLAEGLNFPAARQKAIEKIDVNLAGLLNSPNNILAIEYEKAILRGSYNIKTQSIYRNDEGYHESGSAIRKALKGCAADDKPLLQARGGMPEIALKNCDEIKTFLPEAMIENLKYTCEIEDFADFIFFKLSELTWEDLENYYEVTNEIATRIKKYEKEAGANAKKLVELASAKNITSAAIRRALIHILLGIKKNDEQKIYGRLLGFNKESCVMQEIKKRAASEAKNHEPIEIVTKFADADKDLVKIDRHATEVYNQIVKKVHSINIPDEYHAGVIIF